MHQSVLDFVRRSVELLDLEGADVLEVGAYDVNGSARPIIEQSARLASYLATDMRAGPGVDLVADCCALEAQAPPRSWRLVVCCEMLEHARDWRTAVGQMKRVLRPEGWLLLTTRSHGFPLHDFPHDYWRFEFEDMQRIFADMTIGELSVDPQVPGVFVLAQKPLRFKEANLWDFSVRGPQ